MAGEHHNVAAALLVRDGRVLLCHRHPDRRWYPDVWDMPGGHIAEDETPADALRRELAEELGIVVTVPTAKPWRVLRPEPDLTLHVWVVDQWRGTVENLAPDEHDELGWFWPSETVGLALADVRIGELIGDATGGL